MGLVSRGEGRPRSKLGGCPTPLSADPHLLGKWRQQESGWPGEKMGPQVGVHRATARLRRRDRPAKGAPSCLLPSGPFPPPLCAESGEPQEAGGLAQPPRGGTAGFHLSPLLPELEAPEVLRAWLLRAGPASTGAWAQGGLSNRQSPAWPGPPPSSPGLMQALEVQWPQDRWAGARGPVPTWQGGEEGEWTSREGGLVASPSVQLT